MKKNSYTEPEIQFKALLQGDILAGSSESEVDSDELFDDEEED